MRVGRGPFWYAPVSLQDGHYDGKSGDDDEDDKDILGGGDALSHDGANNVDNVSDFLNSPPPPPLQLRVFNLRNKQRNARIKQTNQLMLIYRQQEHVIKAKGIIFKCILAFMLQHNCAATRYKYMQQHISERTNIFLCRANATFLDFQQY